MRYALQCNMRSDEELKYTGTHCIAASFAYLQERKQ